MIRIEGPLSHHLDHWRSLPSPLTRHVSLSLATSIPATAIFSRTGTVTSVALFPHRALIVSLRLDPCLLLASFSGPAPLLFGRHPAAGTHVGDLLKWPGLNEAGDVGALMQALGGSRQKGGGMKRRDASGRQGGVEVRGVGGTMRTCAQAISASGGGAWVVVAAEDDWVPAALGEDMGDIADPEVRRGQDNGQRDRENVGWGGEEREEGEEKEEGMERSEEEKRGSEKGEASKWASNRVEEWVTQGGAVGRWLEDMAGVTDEKNSTESIEVEQEEEGEKEKERVGEDDAIVVTERIGDRRLLTSAGGIATEDPERPRSAESGASTESAVAGRGLATAIVVEAEMGAWEPQPAAVRGKRLKRIEALMQSSLRRPLRVLRLCLVGITTAIAAVHVAGFVAVMARAKEHDALLGWVDEAGLGLVRVAQVVMHVRVMQGQSVGLLVPGPLASFEVNRSALDSEIRKFLAAHASLYDTQSAFTGRWGRVLSSLWLDEDIDVLVPMSNDVDESNLAPSEMNLWALGNKFAADVLDIAGMSEESLSQTGDLARTGAFAFVSANGIDRLLIRYRLLRDALFDVAVANLGTIGATGLGFLVAEVGVIVPLAVGLLRWGLGGVGETRVRQAAALLAIPRAVVAELWRKEVRVGAEGEDEEEGQRRVEGRTGRWTGPGSRGSGSAVRAALGRKISEETIGGERQAANLRRTVQGFSCCK